MNIATYLDDLTPSDSLVTLEAADIILARTLHGKDWTATIASVLATRASDADPYDETAISIDMNAARPDHMSALRDASRMLRPMIWRQGAHSYLPLSPIPEDIQAATSLLAAYLVEKASQSLNPETVSFYQIGESSASFRPPTRDDLPRHVRTMLASYLSGSATWSPIRP